ncbi:hypothetical protein D0863_00464 [Hortaea werneckii]|uniref:Vacuolar membrane-associated protein IML1 n=1 Tax=Hortaea werneckii TaxID=91943 RepID=A0A3M7EQG5_HORWE|nr:hypothetical protein D0863_00464 [Hortaea werneckii]
MAAEDSRRTCTVVLHDDRVSQDDVLCGVDILATGTMGYLRAAGAKTLCIMPKAAAAAPNEVSLHTSLADRFGFENRLKATVQPVEDFGVVTATHVELYFRDHHLTRADMWRIMCLLDRTVMYRGQRIKYLGSTVAQVEALYIRGTHVESAYTTEVITRPIFRSGSARYTILFQLSREMLQGWIDGELMYERAVDGFVSELFGRWDALGVRHTITLVLFGRKVIGQSDPQDKPTDFYRVIAADVPSTHCHELLRKLKNALNDTSLPRQLTLASDGNSLEAVHIAATEFSNDNIDPHLSSTGASIIAVTAGTGIFATDHALLRDTTHLLMGNSIGVDIVALSPKPLHPVPLFSYEREGVKEFALPHWVDISFWQTPIHKYTPSWSLPAAETALVEVSLPHTNPVDHDPEFSLASAMDHHDQSMFAAAEAPQQPRIGYPDATLSVSASSASTLKKPAPSGEKYKISTARPAEQIHRKELDALSPYAGDSIKPPKSSKLPHALMAPGGRKISLGPKGLAPGRSAASTTITTEHAQHGKEPAMPSTFAPNEGSSGIARQIRQSLAKKSSHQTLSSLPDRTSVETSRPINISASRELDSEAGDSRPLLGHSIFSTGTENDFTNGSTLWQTPKANHDPFYAAMKAAEEEGHWTTSPWVTLLNPCNPKRSNMRVAAHYRKWQHVFPRAVSSSTFKWRSMCSPAALPLTAEYRPSLRQLENYPHKTVRSLVVGNGYKDDSDPAGRVLDQLIVLRLLFGFQQTSIGQHAGSLGDGTEKDRRILMALGNTYHELRYLSDSEIQVVEFSLQDAARPHEEDRPGKHRVKFRSPIMKRSLQTDIGPARVQKQPEWTKLDDKIVSKDQRSMYKSCSQMRLVLIPVDQSRPSHGVSTASRELSDEERRIDGIQKLTQLWQRSRYFTDEDQQHHASLTKSRSANASGERDPNPLAIEYQTRDPSTVINAYGPALTGQLTETESIPPLFGESELYHTSTFDVAKLTAQMQEPPPRGVEARDRRWFTRLHFRCFRGDEMVNWLMRVFKDLHSREDAVAIGNELMRRGIFAHVRHKHAFLDGNFFYQVAGTHRTAEYPDNASMFSKATLRSIPPTPLVERNSPMLRPAQVSSPLSKASNRESESSGRPTPTMVASDKKQLFLSQEMLLNVDTNKKSSQLELLNLHYDRLHNPENCYHIQLEWLTTTPKLIREAIARWASLVEGYGLRLVQVPITEACSLPLEYPLDQPLKVKLALRPPEKNLLATPAFEPYAFAPRAMEDPVAYQKALLRHLDFVLDFEAVASFTTKIDVLYSYGTEDDWYERTSFVHTSGTLLAQITGDDNSDFLLVPNRLSSQKSGTGRLPETKSAEEITADFVSFCHDDKALKAFYDDISKPSTTPGSPFSSDSNGLDSDVPPISLPPHLMHRAALKGIG